MSTELASLLYENGRSHALAAQLIQKGSMEAGDSASVDDLDQYVHNGPYSLALFQSIGLGLELMLKAALVKLTSVDIARLKQEYGHDLIKVFNQLEEVGFETHAENLRQLVELVTPPYREQTFRYGRPDGVNLPADLDQVFATFDILDDELLSLMAS